MKGLIISILCKLHFFIQTYFFFVLSSKETNGGKSFETVKHGSRTLESLADRGPQLDLENKFDALRRS